MGEENKVRYGCEEHKVRYGCEEHKVRYGCEEHKVRHMYGCKASLREMCEFGEFSGYWCCCLPSSSLLRL